MSAGYSGTPLAKKLTLKDGMRVWFDDMPDSILAEIEEAEIDLHRCPSPDADIDAAHIFVTCEASLCSKLADLRQQIGPTGQIWVSWPKKASGMETEVDQEMVRKAGLDAGLVDTKKCAVDETWSGLKFVIPKKDR
ncbi:DUF3052 family protein [Erythrobacter sp. HKB08]|uniref:DUF3052 family protein n=1 Tax=Erythrobacter sp. HKB08 TaxID=2502843 RepID=UPI001008E80F|nr:DUF3052 family protein [Erythrobacter sp. HKB08]